MHNCAAHAFNIFLKNVLRHKKKFEGKNIISVLLILRIHLESICNSGIKIDDLQIRHLNAKKKGAVSNDGLSHYGLR